MRPIFSAVVFMSLALLAPPVIAATPTPPDPVYIRLENGWKGFYAKNNEYVEFQLLGNEIKLQDPYHSLLTPKVELSVGYAPKDVFGGTERNMLEPHSSWVADYYRKNAEKVELKNRDDLTGNNKGIKVTELRIEKKEKPLLKMFLIGIASNEGVFVFSLFSSETNLEPLVKEFISTARLVNKRLNVEEELARHKQTSVAAFSKALIEPPLYIRTEDGWAAFLQNKNECLRYIIRGEHRDFRDAFFVMLKSPELGVHLKYADKMMFGPDGNILENVKKSELYSFRRNGNKAESKDRVDLVKANSGITVTEFSVWGNKPGEFMNLYEIAVLSNSSIYLFTIAPATNASDTYLKTFIDTIKIGYECPKPGDVKKE